MSGDHLIGEGLHEKDKKGGPQVENLPPMGISFILHMQMTLIKPEKALPFAPVWRSSPAGNLLREHGDVATGDSANGPMNRRHRDLQSRLTGGRAAENYTDMPLKD